VTREGSASAMAASGTHGRPFGRPHALGFEARAVPEGTKSASWEQVEIVGQGTAAAARGPRRSRKLFQVPDNDGQVTTLVRTPAPRSLEIRHDGLMELGLG